MKSVTALALVIALAGVGALLPAQPAAAPQQGGQLAGSARHENGRPASNYAVRVRNAGTGQVVGSGTTGANGVFSFSNLSQGIYVVEILDGSGRILATSTSIALATGAMLITGVIITLTESDALVAGAGAGGHFFTSTAGMVVLAVAGAAAIAGVAATKDTKPKSPSK